MISNTSARTDNGFLKQRWFNMIFTVFLRLEPEYLMLIDSSYMHKCQCQPYIAQKTDTLGGNALEYLYVHYETMKMK